MEGRHEQNGTGPASCDRQTPSQATRYLRERGEGGREEGGDGGRQGRRERSEKKRERQIERERGGNKQTLMITI